MGEINVYVDPDASGSGTGVDWTNAYNSLSAAEAAEETDLVTAEDNIVFHCRASSGTADSSRVTFRDWTTSTTYDIQVIGDLSTGKWDTTKYRLEKENDASALLYIHESNITFEKIQIYNDYDSSSTACIFLYDETGIVVDKCLLRTPDSAGGNGFTTGYSYTALDAEIKNTVIYHGGTEGSSTEGIYIISCDSVTITNCTVYNFNDGIERDAGTVTCKNCAVFNCTDCFDGTMTLSYCASDQSETGTGNVQITQSANDYSALVTDAANGDFSVKDTSSELYNAGTNTGAPSDDIIGTSRPQATTTDIGAFEYVTAGGATADVSDTISLSGTLAGLGKYQAAASDNITFGETVSPIATLLATISDIINLADTAAGSSAIAGVISDTLALSDTVAALAGLKGSLTDTISLAESLTALAAWKIAVSDTIELSDEARTNLMASVVDSLGLADTVAGLGNYKSGNADTINLGDTTSGLRALIAAAVDSLDFVASVTGTVNSATALSADVLDSFGLSDSVTASGNYQVTVADGVDLNDATTALAGYLQSIIDTIGLTGTATVIEAVGKVSVTFTLKVPGTTFTLKVPGTTFTLK